MRAESLQANPHHHHRHHHHHRSSLIVDYYYPSIGIYHHSPSVRWMINDHRIVVRLPFHLVQSPIRIHSIRWHGTTAIQW